MMGVKRGVRTYSPCHRCEIGKESLEKGDCGLSTYIGKNEKPEFKYT